MSKGITGSVSSSLKRESYEQFEWKIESFSSLVSTPDCYYHSPRFSFNDSMWYINLSPNPKNGRYFEMYLYATYLAAPMLIHFKFGVEKDDGFVEEWFSSNFSFDSCDHWGTQGAIAESDFLKRKSELIPSDCLSVIIIMSTRIPNLIKYALYQSFHSNADDDETTDMTGTEKILSDIGKLFVSGHKSDLVLCVQGTEFKAHSQILAARIPAISAMFEHETLEKASNKIIITDCEPSIFKEFMFYIYTGTIQNSTSDIYGLYHVADKYLVNDLKLLCRKHIQANLSVETFCDTIKFAQRYDDNGIYQHAIDYFIIHSRLIIRTVEWVRYLQENASEANEILIKSFGPP